MEKQFTKQEVIDLLGQTVQFKEDLYVEYPDHDLRFVSISSGTIADIFSVELHDKQFYLGLYFDVDFELMDKEKFYQYCQIVKSEVTNNACAL